MKKIMLIFVSVLMVINLSGCSLFVKNSGTSNNDYSQIIENNTPISDENNENGFQKSKSIVIYFSRTNNTEKVANYIVEITNSDKYEIQAKVPYTDDDINYNNSNSRANKEQNDSTARPEIKSESIVELTSYDIVYLGYPIWWGQAPKIMYTFVESYDFTEKIIVPFCTSASSGIGSSATNLAQTTNQGTWKEGKRFSASVSKNDVSNWLNTLKLIK